MWLGQGLRGGTLSPASMTLSVVTQGTAVTLADPTGGFQIRFLPCSLLVWVSGSPETDLGINPKPFNEFLFSLNSLGFYCFLCPVCPPAPAQGNPTALQRMVPRFQTGEINAEVCLALHLCVCGLKMRM